MQDVNNIAIIIPTKDRHRELNNLLDSLKKSSVKLGQILVADGGKSSLKIVKNYQKYLSIKHIVCKEIGQVAQRKFALKFIKKNIEVIGYFDDDIVFKEKTISNFLKFWNSFKKKPGGVSLNITNYKDLPESKMRQFFFMQTKPYGKVLKSGYNTPISKIKESIQSQWLLGGATFWRRDILEKYDVEKENSSWAICEDLIFSYPISKIENLYVCSDAKVTTLDYQVINNSFKKILWRSKQGVIRRYKFVTLNNDLSKPLFFWMLIGQLVGYVYLIYNHPLKSISSFCGIIIGIIYCILPIKLK